MRLYLRDSNVKGEGRYGCIEGVGFWTPISPEMIAEVMRGKVRESKKLRVYVRQYPQFTDLRRELKKFGKADWRLPIVLHSTGRLEEVARTGVLWCA